MQETGRGIKDEIEYRKLKREERHRKRRMKKAIISAVTAVCVLVGTAAYTGLHSGSVAEAGNKTDVRDLESGSLSGRTVILHSNDVHGAIDGYAKMASLKKQLESSGAEVIVADTGDFSSETPGDDSFGAIDGFMMMRLAGYNVANLGEAEFAQGYDKLRNDISGAKIRLICSNVLKGDKSFLSPDYIYETSKGSKIGFFGLTSPSSCDGLTFLSGDDMYECAKSRVDTLTKNGADTIIALTHLGTDESTGASSTELYKKVSDIDFIIDGKTHEAVTEGANGEPVQSAGEGFAYIGVIVVGADGGIEDHYIMSTKDIKADESVQADADRMKEHTKVSEVSEGNANADAAAPVETSENVSAKGSGNASKDKSAEKSVTENAVKAEDNKAEDKNKSTDSNDENNKGSVKEQKSAEGKKAEEGKDAADEQKASEDQKAVDEKKSADEQKTTDEKNSVEEQKATDEKKSAEEQKTANDQNAAEETKVTEDQKSVEDQKAAEGQNAGDELAALKDGKYEVVKGDCLWNISKKYLGDGARWGEIYELNKGIISNPSLIYVGQQLVLPPG